MTERIERTQDLYLIDMTGGSPPAEEGQIRYLDADLFAFVNGKVVSLTKHPAGFIEQTFQWSDAPGPVTVGDVPAGSIVEKTILEVLTAFDNGVHVTVGEATAQARLMATSDNRLNRLGSFRVENDYLCLTAMTVKVFFSGTTPTVGVGRVVVYYS